MNLNDNPYKVFGLPSYASVSQIKRRWRELARKHHPETETGDPADYQVVFNAYMKIIEKRAEPRGLLMYCRYCKGEGTIITRRVGENFNIDVPCEICDGTGIR